MVVMRGGIKAEREKDRLALPLQAAQTPILRSRLENLLSRVPKKRTVRDYAAYWSNRNLARRAFVVADYQHRCYEIARLLQPH